MIKGYPENADITIFNTTYLKSQKVDDKWTKDKMMILYKDNQTQKKKFQLIEEPDYEYFRLKDNVMKQDYNEFFTEKDNVESVKVPYNSLEKHLAEESGNLDFYYDNIRNGNRRQNEQLHLIDTGIFNSDTHIEDHYRYRFNKLYKNDIIPISKSYLDIEVDTINMKGDFPEMGVNF